jgi:hypothetical protein
VKYSSGIPRVRLHVGQDQPRQAMEVSVEVVPTLEFDDLCQPDREVRAE